MAYEAYITLTFNEPCIGNQRRPDDVPNEMLKGADGRVIFPQAWWRNVVGRAAAVYGKHQQRIIDVLWTPEIDGTIKYIKRYYGAFDKAEFRLHEGFDRGDSIGAKALVPDDIALDDFTAVLKIAGQYFGISPFGWRQGYGKFSVTKVEKIYGRVKTDTGNDPRQPDVHQD